ncbi:MAG: thioredoxin family protein [Chitinophagales bacterium]|nr:thioredoxin family protein [Chitinophagales bacterium]
MKQTFLVVFLLLGFLLSAQNEQKWLVNFEEAKKEAQSQSRHILVSFSGSDWCGNCMRLSQDLFESQEFKEFATENLILLNLDFPAKKANKLSAEQTAHNDALAEKFNPTGVFPLTLVLNEKGELISKMKYPCKNVEEYLHEIQLALRK